MRHPTAPMFRLSLLGTCLALAACGGGSQSPATPPTPPANQAPFTPGPGDLPHAANLYPYAAPSLLTLDMAYQPTPVSGPDWYLVDKHQCAQLPSPPPSYPGSLVTLDTVNLDEIKDDACEPEIQVLATSGDGQAQAAPAKLRQRGSSTRFADLKSYRLKFDKGVAWWGEDTLNLNKHPYDLARVRNKLAFDLMRTVPYHESLRTQFAQIRYDAGNGTGAQPMGLFTNVEKLGGKTYLERRGWVAGSNVYKVAEFNFNADTRLTALADGKAGPGFTQLLEIESDSGNHKAIVAAVQALDDGGKPFATTFNRYFDRNNYLAWLATAILLGNWDTVNQNFGLYQPLGSEKFYFLPWDYDGALGYPEQASAPARPAWDKGISAWWDSALHRRFLSAPGNLALLNKAVEEIRSQYLTDAAVKQLLDSYRPIVEPLLAAQPDASHLETQGDAPALQQWAAEYQRLQTAIGANHAFFAQSLQRPMPYWQAAKDKAGSLALDWGWPAAFHPQGKPISYRVEVARATSGTAAFAPETLAATPAVVAGRTALDVGPLPAGKYLVRVTASDADGNRTSAFDSTDWNGQAVEGAICVTMPGAAPC